MFPRAWRRLAGGEWVAVGSLFLAMAWAAAAQRHLWADGAFYYIQVASDRFFTMPVFAREHARIAGEWIEVALLWAGVREGRVLSVAYGLGHLLPVPAE
jgi:uncharacterized protein YhbP (UPF0306 family)